MYHLVTWGEVQKPFHLGGLGLRFMEEVNRAL